MWMPYILFVLGLIFIIKGGDYFVDSATWVAKVTRLPEVLIGATIVSVATTFPETMVSVLSVMEKQPAMALGNAVGSTICNTGLILGLYNIIKPTKITSRVFPIKGLMLLAYLLIFWVLSTRGVIGGFASYILLSMVLVYILMNIAMAVYKKSRLSRDSIPVRVEPKQAMYQVLMFVIGITLIIFGSNLLVTHGVVLAKMWGVPSSVISLTLIAVGTSLPELVTAVTALLKGHAALSIGNIIGANILNISMVLGISSRIMPLEISKQALYLDIPASIAINALLILPSIITKRISRVQGIILFALYAFYVFLLFYIYNPT